MAVLCLLLDTSPACARDRSGFAVAAGIGASVIRDEDGTETFRGTAAGFTFGVEYRFVPAFGLSLATFNLGKASDVVNSVDTTIDVRGIDLQARFYFPAFDRGDAFLLVGGANYYTDIDPGVSFDPFGQGAWELGAGFDLDGSENLSLRFEGRFFNGPQDESAGLLTVGFNYRF